MKHSFGSDNHSGVHPNIIDAIIKANQGFETAYGEDRYSEGVLKKIESLFGGDCTALFVINGTGANILSLSVMTHSTESVICPVTAHINVDECGSPEKIVGCKLVTIGQKFGKVTPEEVKSHLVGYGFQHHSQPKVLAISQPTELGTVYTVDEIKALTGLMHDNGGCVYMDGSRLSNAADSLGLPFKSFTADAGVDAVSFGGTKNGMLMGEAVIFFNSINADKAKYLRKQITQLYSKGRFIAAQFEEYMKNNLYLMMAAHSNAMAKYLESKLQRFPSVKITAPVQTNAVFATIPKDLYEKLSAKHTFYIWDESTMEVRWMCSFNTHKEDIDNFINDIE